MRYTRLPAVDIPVRSDELPWGILLGRLASANKYHCKFRTEGTVIEKRLLRFKSPADSILSCDFKIYFLPKIVGLALKLQLIPVPLWKCCSQTILFIGRADAKLPWSKNAYNITGEQEYRHRFFMRPTINHNMGNTWTRFDSLLSTGIGLNSNCIRCVENHYIFWNCLNNCLKMDAVLRTD